MIQVYIARAWARGVFQESHVGRAEELLEQLFGA
jgi:hypothetical protein